MERTYILYGGIIDYEPHFLSKEESLQLFNHLKENVTWEQKYYTHRTSGAKYPQPRLTAWYADNPNMEYSYSGVTQKVQGWTSNLLSLKSKIEEVTKASYNSVLLNYYRDNSDSVGLHADDEKELGINANIASISLGAEREFTLSNYRIPKDPSLLQQYSDSDKKNIKMHLANGSLLVMSGTTQHYWKHSVPKSDELISGRINLTFRKFF